MSMNYYGMYDMDVLMQEKCNSSALAMELHLTCTNPSICEMYDPNFLAL